MSRRSGRNSSHTYMWINAEGVRFWVKYHFKTDQGVEYFTRANLAVLPVEYR